MVRGAGIIRQAVAYFTSCCTHISACNPWCYSVLEVYCKSCLDVSRSSDVKLDSNETFVHKRSAEAVCRAYGQGCDISGRLWTQLINHPDRPFGDRRWYRLSTVCILRQTRDQREVRSGRRSADPCREELYSSGLRYKLDFSWRNLGYSRIDSPPPIQFYLLAAQSKGQIFLQRCLQRANASPELLGSLGDYVPDPRNDCSASWELQKNWIRDCSENHPACRSVSGDWMPTRVLDVGNTKCSIVRLIETRPQAVNGPYLTLSHCWGQSEVVKLTTANKDSMHNGIPVPGLPLLYQDAVTVCRRLEIRYLWIDSLCIIQDQELDWAGEKAAMGDVYSNAICNIEASSAVNVSGRLCFSRNQTRITPFPISVEWHQDGPLPFFLIDLSVQLENDMIEAPLLKRAWVVQEQLLAKRSIIYSKT